MKRFNDWRARFAAEINRQRRDPMAWGQHDCVIGLACGVIHALTGEDMAREYRNKYRSERSALKLLKSAGADTLGDFIAVHLSEYAHPSEARIGDVGIIDAEGLLGEAACVFDFSAVIVLTETGLGHLPHRRVLRAFQVG